MTLHSHPALEAKLVCANGLAICLLLDRLYLKQHVLSLVDKHRCQWIITFKEDSLPDAYSEFEARRRLLPDQQIETTDGVVRHQYC